MVKLDWVLSKKLVYLVRKQFLEEIRFHLRLTRLGQGGQVLPVVTPQLKEEKLSYLTQSLWQR